MLLWNKTITYIIAKHSILASFESEWKFLSTGCKGGQQTIGFYVSRKYKWKHDLCLLGIELRKRHKFFLIEKQIRLEKNLQSFRRFS